MRRATETSMGSAPRAAALRSLATTRHDALSPQYAGKCCSISSRTSASVRSCITSGMTSGRGSGRDQFGLGRGHSYATQTPAWPENRHDRPSGRATDQRFRPIPSSFKRVRCALGPATARPAPPSAQQRPALGDAPRGYRKLTDPQFLTAARGLAGRRVSQELQLPFLSVGSKFLFRHHEFVPAEFGAAHRRSGTSNTSDWLRGCRDRPPFMRLSASASISFSVSAVSGQVRATKSACGSSATISSVLPPSSSSRCVRSLIIPRQTRFA